MSHAGVQERFLSVPQVAEWLGVAPKWVYRHVAADGPEGLPHYRVGGQLRFSVGEIEQWLETRRGRHLGPINAA
jgi:excisionase family DNA binding protein